ncbi:MAG TPA: MotA/TolQ/ExbB proton channel family protein, partial [Rhodopila sp.]|nr:MotA/TolQ/ExbB proton channel family protein [Rhodopila sp.]
MTRPTGYLLRMLVFLVLVGGVAALLSPVLITAFYHNPLLNSFILLILALGILWNLNQVLRLRPEVTWVETYQVSRSRLAALPSPRLLAPMASMLAMRDSQSRGDGRSPTLSTTAMRTMLDGISSRLDESRELSRYMTGLLIFLGLLGTFWGLLKTVTSVSDVIASMTLGNGDMNLMFEQLKSGLAQPLAGMGTAFSASMYGLAGALVLGFLDLTAGQAQNRFFN